MAENQDNRPNKLRQAHHPDWELRSPGRPAESATQIRFNHAPKSASHVPQHARLDPSPAAPPSAPVEKARDFKIEKNGLARLFSKPAWLIAGSAALAVASLATIFLRQAAPSETKPSQPTAMAGAEPEQPVMGTGQAYAPSSENTALQKSKHATGRSFSVTPDPEQIAKPSAPAHRHTNLAIQTLIDKSARQEGLHPDLMVYLFGKESGSNKFAVSDTGATGLCQFTEQTFLSNMKKHGPRLGFGDYASAIDSYYSKRQERTFLTAGNREREILNLRFKPEVAIPLCAAHIRDDLMLLKPHVNRPLTFTDSSLSHFTGAAVAKDILRALAHPQGRFDPAWIYAERVNYQGVTNMNVFFHNGDRRKPYTVEQLYKSKLRVMGDMPALAGASSVAFASPRP